MRPILPYFSEAISNSYRDELEDCGEWEGTKKSGGRERRFRGRQIPSPRHLSLTLIIPTLLIRIVLFVRHRRKESESLEGL